MNEQNIELSRKETQAIDARIIESLAKMQKCFEQRVIGQKTNNEFFKNIIKKLKIFDDYNLLTDLLEILDKNFRIEGADKSEGEVVACVKELLLLINNKMSLLKNSEKFFDEQEEKEVIKNWTERAAMLELRCFVSCDFLSFILRKSREIQM
jgi:cysteinyl-tRNA synthetase